MIKTTLFLMLTVPLLLHAQDSTQTAKGFVSIETEPAGAEVYLDSVRVGVTPIERLETPEGRHRVQVFYPSAGVWNGFVRTEELRVEAGDEVRLSYEFGSYFSVRSVPAGASVLYDGKQLGVTPLIFKSTSAISGPLLLQKEHFEPVTLDLSDSSRLFVALKSMGGTHEPPPEVLIEEHGKMTPRLWATYGSALGMVGSGILAAYFKDRANKKFDLFLSTQKSSYLSSTRRLDRQSAIALAATEICFVVLSYLLFSD